MELAVTMTATVTNPTPGDLLLSDAGDEVLLTDLASEVAQRLFVALQFFKGEWFLDQNEGVPYFQRILKKNPGDRVIRSIFSQVITRTEGVSRLLSFRYTIGRDRHMSIVFKALLEDGTTFSSTDYAQFLVGDV